MLSTCLRPLVSLSSFYKYSAKLPLTLADESADVAVLQYKTGTIHHDLCKIVAHTHSVIIIFITFPPCLYSKNTKDTIIKNS